MKCFVLFSILSVSRAAINKDVLSQYNEGDRFFFFPGDGDGVLHLVDINESIDEDFILKYTRQPNNSGYWLFTRSHPLEPHMLVHDDFNSITRSDFNINKTTVLLIHGWLGSGDNKMNQLLTEGKDERLSLSKSMLSERRMPFLEDDDVNVIVFDWRKLANRNYLTAKNGVVALGRSLGLFVTWLESLGVPYNNMHLVGFSLGAHIAGNAGRCSGSLVKRITALDPAGPLWQADANRLKASDAQYVEVIHTNTYMYGYTEPCGHADFYPNGGSTMPGCWINICSHSKGYEYMAMSVKYNHMHANQCKNLDDMTSNDCDGDLYPMGNSHLNKSQSGIFRINTS